MDYAETRPEAVATLLLDLSHRHDQPPVLVVLVVRQLSTTGELERHLTSIRATGEGRDKITQLLRKARLYRLNDHKHTIDRRELFTRAAEAFALKMEGTAPGDAPDLDKEHFGQPLYVTAAALLAVNGSSRDVSTLTGDELLGAILDEHEAYYWARWTTRLEKPLKRDIQRRMVALAALLGAANQTETGVVVDLGFTSLGLTDQAGQPSRVREVSEWLTCLYGPLSPSGGTGLRPLEPDQLAEVLIARELNAQPDLITKVLQVDSKAQLTRALNVLTRLARDRTSLRAPIQRAFDEHLPALIRRQGRT